MVSFVWDNAYAGAGSAFSKDVAVDTAGNVIVVGSFVGAFDFGGGVRTSTSGGTETQVNSTTSSNQDDPAVASLSGGGYVVVWESYNQDGSYDGVFGQRFDANGNTVGGEFQVNTYGTNSQDTPSLAIAPMNGSDAVSVCVPATLPGVVSSACHSR